MFNMVHVISLSYLGSRHKWLSGWATHPIKISQFYAKTTSHFLYPKRVRVQVQVIQEFIWNTIVFMASERFLDRDVLRGVCLSDLQRFVSVLLHPRTFCITLFFSFISYGQYIILSSC
jgi:hypothetical protein